MRHGLSTVLLLCVALDATAAPPAPQRATTEHLEVTAFVAETAVAPGTPFSLVLEVIPKRGIHVYAPGARGYRAITLALDRHPLLVTRPLVYPRAETYHFRPLDERVAVFRQPFRLSQPLTVSAAAADRPRLAALHTVTIRGTLHYQACDDRVCFKPRALPIAVDVPLRR